jgi:ABC-type sugar transport system ATPase subunit
VSATPAVRFRQVSKSFPGVRALDDVTFSIAPGSCHAICGENGAGKSTLGKILAGIDRPDSGTIEVNGREVEFANPRAAMVAGIAIVHQELALCGNLSVEENLCLSALPRRGAILAFGSFVDRAKLRSRAKELLDGVGAEIDPGRELASLSVAEQQLVQIAAAVGANAGVIIFDEPTSSLGQREADNLYEVIARLRSHGTTLIFVSHRMQEIFRLCDTVTVLRDGQHVATRPVEGLEEAELVEMMIGRRIDEFFPSHTAVALGAEVLRVDRLASGHRLRDVSFTLRAGEVLGVAGLVGAGRSELAQAIFGLHRNPTGSIYVRGNEVRIRSPRDAMAHGIGLVPEDRKRLGLVLSMVNRENGSLPILDRVASVGWVNDALENSVVGDSFARVRFSSGHESATATLSGGNQQKVVLAKWLAARSDILILDEPTRGIDVGAKAELHAWIDRHASGGGAVLLISSDMPELLNISSRLIVLREGRVAGELSRAEATQDKLVRMMAGV